MPNNIRKIIKNIIVEVLCKQSDIDNVSNVLTQTLIDNVKQYKHIVFDRNVHSMSARVNAEQNENNIIKISSIKVEFDFSINSPQKISGSFLTNKTKLIDNGFYEATIELKINTGGENLNFLKTKIEAVIAHELNHAFVYVKKISKPSKTHIYNKVNKISIREFLDFPSIVEFSKMFYLNLPEEIQARVQETATILKNIEAKNYNDAIRELNQYQPINDAKKMINYNLDRIKSTNKIVLNKFIKTFNKDLDLVKEKNDIDIKKINDVEEFFKYWEK